MSIDKFIQDGQDSKVVEKIYAKIVDMLTSGESLNYIALQKKPAVTILPDSITVSNKRIFLCEFTKLGLATNFEIFSWTDIKDIAFKEEIFGSKVTVIPFTGENLTIDYIPKVQARKLYQLIKESLEKKETNAKEGIKAPEKPAFQATPTPPAPTTPTPVVPATEPEQIKRVSFFDEETERPETLNERLANKSEESFQASTPSYSSTPPAPAIIPPAPAPAPVKEEDDEITVKLKKLKTLYDKQLITQAEYENKKSDLLDQL
ncbi:PH domain-containing protein [Sphingobacterium hungaricum]